jgi:phosphoribosylformimino-5-aminoimidazole carboxamide ribotide isomerase
MDSVLKGNGHVEIFPAIDLKQDSAGRCRCVRLRQGRADAETEFSDDPVAVARRWQACGAEWLHVVDLDGAFQGRPVNTATIASIREAVTMHVQVGGGVRGDDAARQLLFEVGADRIVVGTRALVDPEWVSGLCRRFPLWIVGGIDARDGRVAVKGWTEDSGTDTVDAARKLANCGVAALVFTDIATDGMMRGPNVAATKRLAESVDVPVIASGGVSTMEDVRALAGLPIEGIIIGRALYDGTIDLAEAVRIARQGGAEA